MADNILARMLPMTWPVTVTDPATPASGDPVRFGSMTGIAMLDEGDGGVSAATITVVDFGMYVADHPVTDVVAGIAVGDTVYYVDANDRLENLTSGTPYGIALETVGAGLTTTIQVLHAPHPALGAGTVATAALAAGILSADAPGRAKFAAGVFDAATALSVFGADSMTNAFLLDAVQNGAFVADAATRALFADGFVNGAKLATGILKMEAIAGGDETGAGVDIAVTGMAVGDELVGVLVLTTAAAIATLAQRPLADFTVAAAKLTVAANPVNNTGNQYLVFWIDHT